MVDYQHKNFLQLLQELINTGVILHIDRTAYYTTEMHLTNEVEMPDMASYNVRTGIRTFQHNCRSILSAKLYAGRF